MAPVRKEPDLDSYQGRCGKRLQALREKAKKTVTEVAEELKVSYGAVYRWESGKADPKLAHLPALARLYGLKSPRDVLAPK